MLLVYTYMHNDVHVYYMYTTHPVTTLTSKWCLQDVFGVTARIFAAASNPKDVVRLQPTLCRIVHIAQFNEILHIAAIR